MQNTAFRPLLCSCSTVKLPLFGFVSHTLIFALVLSGCFMNMQVPLKLCITERKTPEYCELIVNSFLMRGS